MSKADDILFFDVIFLLMVATFSAATSNSFDLSTYTTQIFAPWPSAPPVATQSFNQTKPVSCVWYDAICQANNALTSIKTQANATTFGPLAVIGGGIVWLVLMAFSFFSRIIVFGNLITFLMFNPAITGSGGVPFLPIIIIGLNVYVIWELIRTFRGQSTGV